MDTYLNNHLNITYKLNKVKLSSFGVDFTNIFFIHSTLNALLIVIVTTLWTRYCCYGHDVHNDVCVCVFHINVEPVVNHVST